MQLEELTRAMHAGDAPGVSQPVDVAVIRAKGLRRRRTQRGVVAGVTAASVGAVMAGLSALGAGGVGHAVPQYVDTPQEHHLTSVQRQALKLDGAYPVDGVVVVPAPDTPVQSGTDPVTRPSQVAQLGFHGFTRRGFLNSDATFPKFLQQVLPANPGVVVDNGPAWLACRRVDVQTDCRVSEFVGNPDRQWFLLKSLGGDRFLQPGAGMEVTLNRVYVDHQARQSVIGGFDGTAASRVVLTLADGSTVGTTIDKNNVSPGDTLFWAVVDQPVAKATAYDAAGNVVLEHDIPSCTDGIDCEVR